MPKLNLLLSQTNALSCLKSYNEGPEGVKWELGLAFCCPGKMGFWVMGLGFGHWELEKKVKMGMG